MYLNVYYKCLILISPLCTYVIIVHMTVNDLTARIKHVCINALCCFHSVVANATSITSVKWLVTDPKTVG